MDVRIIRIKKFLKKYWFTLVTLGISMTILLIFLFHGNSLEQLVNIFHNLHLGWMLAAFITVIGGYLLEALCDFLLCRHLTKKWNFGQSFMIGMTGLLYSAVTPFSTGGQPMQIYYMSKMGMQPGAAGAVISELPFFQTHVSNLSFLTLFGLTANLIFIAAVVLISVKPNLLYKLLHKLFQFLHKIHLLKNPENTYQKVTQQLDTFHEGFKTMGKNVRLYVSVCLLTVVQITLTNSTTYWIIMAAQVFATMIAAFVPLPGASGGAEGTFLAFCKIFFQNMLTPAMLIWRLMTYYSNILFGGLTVAVGSKHYVGKEEPKNNPDMEPAEQSEGA